MVYVDALRDWGWSLGPSCHCFATTVDELNALAAKIGMKRSWLQHKYPGDLPHYDLIQSKRILALKLGAVDASDECLIYHTNKYLLVEIEQRLLVTPDDERLARIKARAIEKLERYNPTTWGHL